MLGGGGGGKLIWNRVDPVLVNTGLLLHLITGSKWPPPTRYINYSNLVRCVSCSFEVLSGLEREGGICNTP